MRKSFTLIELIVVIGIIALLSALGVSSYSGFQQTARDSRRKADLEIITNALNSYYAANGRFPPSAGWVYSTSGANNWIPGLVPTYIESLPIDPINVVENASGGAGPWNATYANYVYAYGVVSTDGQQYDLNARLENTSDPDRCGAKNYYFHWNPKQLWCGSYTTQIYEVSPNSF